MDDLALQVGEIDRVVVDHAQGADPGRGEILQEGRAKPAGAEHQHPGSDQLRLATPPISASTICRAYRLICISVMSGAVMVRL